MQTPKFVDINGHTALKWQFDFLREFSGKVEASEGSANFLLCAAPNSGKTRAAGFAMAHAAEKFQTELFVVVVPNCAIKRQWASEILPYGISLSMEQSNARLAKRGGIDSALDGIVVTYSQVSQMPELFRKLCHSNTSMVCFDEVHHLGDEKTWGTSALQAFEHADIKLSLSGTPFRCDGQSIPFQEYENAS
jgi:superfamily II DNA or RNA helicase